MLIPASAKKQMYLCPFPGRGKSLVPGKGFKRIRGGPLVQSPCQDLREGKKNAMVLNHERFVKSNVPCGREGSWHGHTPLFVDIQYNCIDIFYL